MPDLNREKPAAAIVDHKGAPLLPDPKEGARGNLQNTGALPNDDARIDAIAVPKPVRRIDEIGDHIGSLLFDSERGDFGEAIRLDGSHLGAQGRWRRPSSR